MAQKFSDKNVPSSKVNLFKIARYVIKMSPLKMSILKRNEINLFPLFDTFTIAYFLQSYIIIVFANWI